MAFFFLVVLLGSPPAIRFAAADAPVQQGKAGVKVEKAAPVPQSNAQEAKPAGEEKKGDVSIPNIIPVEPPMPVNAEKIDEAGERLGNTIDQVGNGAAKTFGKWINAKSFAGISWLRLLVCFLLFLLVVAIERIVRYVIVHRLGAKEGEEATARWWQLFLDALSKPLSLFIRVYGIYWALSPILAYFDDSGTQNLIHRAAGKAADVGGTVALFWFVYRFVHVFDIQLRRWVASSQNTIDEMLVPLVGKTLRVFIIIIGSIMVIQNMTGIEIGPLIASLGIGGLAIALAGKDSIANFLGSLTILFDKPFQVGERIVIEKHDGFVEDVGFRSTRIRTLRGTLVSIPNEKIINSTLENVNRRAYIRWNTNLALHPGTPPEKIERAVQIVHEALDNHECMNPKYPPRVQFTGSNEWSLNLAVYAWYHDSDFWRYQEWVQKMSLEIMRGFGAEGIELVFRA